MSHAPPRKPMRAMALGAAAVAVSFLSYAASQSDNTLLQVHRLLTAMAPGESTPGDTHGPSSANANKFAPMSASAQLAREAAVRKSPSTEKQIFGAHVQPKALRPSQRMPYQSPLAQVADTGYDHASMRKNVLKRPSIRMQSAKIAQSASAAAAAACDVNQFGSLSGSALVSAVKSATTTCINDLFSLSGTTAYNTFREAQMVTIANALSSSAASYNGTNSGSTLQLILFLRAGYYVQYYDTSVGTYGAPLKSAVRSALDTFANNSSFGLVNDVHGEVLAEFVTLIDSSAENARYLPAVKRLLDSYTSSHNAYYWMKVAVNNTFLVTFRGHQNADFQALVQSDSSIVDTLYNFANRNFSMLGLEDDYLVANAGREIGRFLQYTGSLKSVAQSRAKALVDRSSVTGPTAKMWVGVGEMVDYYDKANCSYYNQCNFSARVEAAALPISHTCSSTLRIRAQAMSASELSSTCSIVMGEEGYFHQQVASGNTPVANDNNTALEMVVFDSSTDYGTYAGAIYGIDTNNGGMYLEGDPAAAGNQARFIAYEAEWLRPGAFEIWNLTHEYIHYLDGRFNMFGDFGASISQKTVWWIEGFAEYMSYSYRNLVYAGARDQAALGTYTLSRVYQNDYNSGQTLVYNWGYLAVRFMFEQRRSTVSTILGYLRQGNYTGYASFMNSIGTSNDTAFRNWLPCVGNPNGPGCSGNPTNQLPTASFSVATSGLTANFTDGSTDPDGSIASRSWNFGDGTSSTSTNPSKTYGAAGTYTVTLTVTDNQGGTNTRSQSVTVTGGSTPGSALTNGVAKTGLSAAAGGKLEFTLDVPAGATNLKFVMSGGTGDADMYVKFGSAPTTTAYDCRPYAGGNAETCTITTAQAGRYYVMLNAYAAFSGVSLTGSYTAGGTNTPPVAGFSFTSSGLTATFTDSSSDANGTIASRAWSFGDGTSSTATNPSKTYATAGTYTVQLTVTDNQGATNTISKSVTVTAGGGLPECTGDPTSLGKNCARSNLSATAGQYVYMYVYIPQGTTQLRINTSGGTGNADLYVSTLGSWATTTSHNYRSINAGNTESVTINNPASGYVYISLYAAAAFSGVKVTTQY